MFDGFNTLVIVRTVEFIKIVINRRLNTFIVANLLPPSHFLKIGKRKYSEGVKSGEWGVWGSNSNFNLLTLVVNNRCVNWCIVLMKHFHQMRPFLLEFFGQTQRPVYIILAVDCFSFLKIINENYPTRITRNWRRHLGNKWNCLSLLLSRFSPFCPLS